MKHEMGDKVLLKQTKTLVKLSFDPEDYKNGADQRDRDLGQER